MRESNGSRIFIYSNLKGGLYISLIIAVKFLSNEIDNYYNY